jgi:hypothetical protein
VLQWSQVRSPKPTARDAPQRHRFRRERGRSGTQESALYRLCAEELEPCIRAVEESHREELLDEPALEALVDRAHPLQRPLEARRLEVGRAERLHAHQGPAHGRSATLCLRRCRPCDGVDLWVRAQPRLDSDLSELERAVIVCAACSDLRLQLSPEQLRPLGERLESLRVELPGDGLEPHVRAPAPAGPLQAVKRAPLRPAHHETSTDLDLSRALVPLWTAPLLKHTFYCIFIAFASSFS